MKSAIFRALGTVLLILTSSSTLAGSLMVSDPWVRAAPPGAPALGAFMILENHSDSDISVIEARTTLAAKNTELHRTIMTDGIMKMIPQQSIPVAAHSTTILKPGSWHIMLIKPEKVPVIGDTVELTLVLSDGSEQKVTAQVRKGEKMHMNHKHEMKMDGEGKQEKMH